MSEQTTVAERAVAEALEALGRIEPGNEEAVDKVRAVLLRSEVAEWIESLVSETVLVSKEEYAASPRLADALREALPACPIYGDHKAHQYWLSVSDRGYEALEAFAKARGETR